nr:Hypothetical protein [Pseudomonas aeruginosa]
MVVLPKTKVVTDQVSKIRIYELEEVVVLYGVIDINISHLLPP